jgi:hypothetical protein
MRLHTYLALACGQLLVGCAHVRYANVPGEERWKVGKCRIDEQRAQYKLPHSIRIVTFGLVFGNASVDSQPR